MGHSQNNLGNHPRGYLGTRGMCDEDVVPSHRAIRSYFFISFYFIIESAGRSEKSGKRLSKGANRSRLRSVSPDEDAAAWKAPGKYLMYFSDNIIHEKGNFCGQKVFFFS